MFSLQELDDAFSFHGAARKNASFSSSLNGQNFFIHKKQPLDACFLHVHAGGSISYTAPLSYEMRPLPYCLLLLVINGNAKLNTSDSAFSLGANGLLFLPAQKTLSFTAEQTPFTCRLYFLSGQILDTYLRHLRPQGTNNPPVFDALARQSISCIDAAMRQLDVILRDSAPESCFFACYQAVTLFTELVRSSTPGPSTDILPPHVACLRQILDEQFASYHTLDQLAQYTGVSKYRLCRDFSASIGLPPLQYLNRVRIEKAQALLSTTDLTIHAIGSMVGIPNTSHFIRLFSRTVGITPLQYRQQYTPFT